MELRACVGYWKTAFTLYIHTDASIANVRPDKSYIYFFVAVVKRMSHNLFTPIWRDLFQCKCYNKLIGLDF